MKKFLVVGVLILMLAACAAEADTQPEISPEVTIYKSPTWGCCGDWGEYLEDNGFEVEEVNTADLRSIKTQYQIPSSFQACHTAIVDGYVIEGHVPAAEIRRLLQERPNLLGIAVAGMPPGSPGMEVADFDSEPFEVVSFDEAGNIDVYAKYP